MFWAKQCDLVQKIYSRSLSRKKKKKTKQKNNNFTNDTNTCENIDSDFLRDNMPIKCLDDQLYGW